MPPLEGGRGGGLVRGSIQTDLTVKTQEISLKPQTRARVGRGDAREYPAEFEAVWAGCVGRRGNKWPACRAWLKFKLPASVICPVYLQWNETDQWQRGFVPHLATWLNDRGWESAPSPQELAPRTEPARAPVLPLALRIEDARAARVVDARIESLKESGVLRLRNRPPEVPEHIRALADGKATT